MTHHSTCPYPILLVGLCSHVLIFLSLFRRSEKFWPPLFKSRLSWVMWDVNGARHTSSHFPRANTFTYPVYIEMCRSTSAQGKVNSKLKILKFVGTPIFTTYSFQCLFSLDNTLMFWSFDFPFEIEMIFKSFAFWPPWKMGEHRPNCRHNHFLAIYFYPMLAHISSAGK